MKRFFIIDVLKMFNGEEFISAAELKSKLNLSEGAISEKAALTEDSIMSIISYKEIVYKEELYKEMLKEVQRVRVEEGVIVDGVKL